jgi:hypothetical protein
MPGPVTPTFFLTKNSQSCPPTTPTTMTIAHSSTITVDS